MKKLSLLISAIFFLQGCSTLMAGKHTLSSLSAISVGMEKSAVKRIMGKPNVVRIGKKLSDDKVYELHEYKLYEDGAVFALSFFLLLPASPLLGTETFWLHYVNSRLVFWGDEGDWRGAPKWFCATYVPPVAEQPFVAPTLPQTTDTP